MNVWTGTSYIWYKKNPTNRPRQYAPDFAQSSLEEFDKKKRTVKAVGVTISYFLIEYEVEFQWKLESSSDTRSWDDKTVRITRENKRWGKLSNSSRYKVYLSYHEFELSHIQVITIILTILQNISLEMLTLSEKSDFLKTYFLLLMETRFPSFRLRQLCVKNDLMRILVAV